MSTSTSLPGSCKKINIFIDNYKSYSILVSVIDSNNLF